MDFKKPLRLELHAPGLWQRVQGAYQYLRCSGESFPAPKIAMPTDRNAASSGDADATDKVKEIVWQCGNRHMDCQRCPRFQAYWQAVGIKEALIQHGKGEVSSPR